MSLKNEADDVPVNGTDELSMERDGKEERIRRFGDYKPTNVPLSAQELADREARLRGDKDKSVWPHSNTNAIHEVVPAQDKPMEEDKPVV